MCMPSVLSTPTQKVRILKIGSVVYYGNHQVKILDTKPGSDGTNYHRIQFTKDGTTLTTRVSANDLR